MFVNIHVTVGRMRSRPNYAISIRGWYHILVWTTLLSWRDQCWPLFVLVSPPSKPLQWTNSQAPPDNHYQFPALHNANKLIVCVPYITASQTDDRSKAESITQCSLSMESRHACCLRVLLIAKQLVHPKRKGVGVRGHASLCCWHWLVLEHGFFNCWSLVC